MYHKDRSVVALVYPRVSVYGVSMDIAVPMFHTHFLASPTCVWHNKTSTIARKNGSSESNGNWRNACIIGYIGGSIADDCALCWPY